MKTYNYSGDNCIGCGKSGCDGKTLDCEWYSSAYGKGYSAGFTKAIETFPELKQEATNITNPTPDVQRYF